MHYTRPRSNGTSYGVEHRASIVRAVRGDLPPPAGERWELDSAQSHAQLTTSHPTLGVRSHKLGLVAGTLTVPEEGQLVLAAAFGCSHAGGGGRKTEVLFRSASVSRPETFRYVAKGALQVGDVAGIGVLRIRDLSWTAAADQREEARILTITATLERHFWDFGDNGVPTPWPTRDTAEVFLHTEWSAQEVAPPAA